MIIVTGAAGFIGSQIALNLAKTNEKLLLVDHKNAFNERKYTGNISKQIRFMDAGAEFLDALDDIEEAAIEDVSWVIHMGAITNTAETDLDALNKWNVEYSKAIWEFCTDNEVNLVYASSAATYGDGQLGFKDDEKTTLKLKPLNLYGRSKQEFDLFALEQKETPPNWYGVKYFNVYGPNEAHKGRMASAIWHGYKEIIETGAMTLFRSHNPQVPDGDQARDFIHVSDVLNIIDFFFDDAPDSGIYNVGTGNAGTFKDLAEALFSALKKPVKINWVDTPEEFRAAYQYRTQADIKKLKLAGFTQEFKTLKEGVEAYLPYLK